jgi:thioredoxin-related protein
MKKLLFPGLALFAITLMSFAFSELPLGAELPKADRKMKDVTGKDVSLKDATKKNGLLVMFSCNTCPYVIKNQSRTNDISNYALKSDVGVIIVNSNEGMRSGEDSYDAMKQYAKNQGYQWHYVVDTNSELADAFGAKRTPEAFLFDSKGKLVYHGAIDDNPTDASSVTRYHLKEAISEMTNGKDITVKTSRSVGCTIKRPKS